MWSLADAYLDLAASAADATEHFRDQMDREVEKLFWSQFNNPEHPLPLTDRLAEWAELNRLSGLAMKYGMSHLWPERPEPKSYFNLVQQFPWDGASDRCHEAVDMHRGCSDGPCSR